jgi:hypothetical protein
LRLSPTLIPTTPESQPLMTSATPATMSTVLGAAQRLHHTSSRTSKSNTIRTGNKRHLVRCSGWTIFGEYFFYISIVFCLMYWQNHNQQDEANQALIRAAQGDGHMPMACMKQLQNIIENISLCLRLCCLLSMLPYMLAAILTQSEGK